MYAFRKWMTVAAAGAFAFGIGYAHAAENKSAPDAPPVVTTDQVQQVDDNDPFEGSNRFFFNVNQALDKALLRPVAIAYHDVLPDFARDGVRNFLNNLNSPVIFANDLLQGEGDRAGTTMVRFGINTTIGVAGLFDVASDLGYPYHDEDFGQTLAVWGVNDGPYFYFLVLGPSSARDFTGFVVDRGLDPLTYVGWGDDYEWVPITRAVVNVIDLRSRNIETLDEIERTSVDYYASIRSLYRQSRADAIRNGKPSTDLPDFDNGGGVTTSPIN
ncbi:MAG: VacJ family lipoprotein [Alphaproteobacteria bacterium]|nr:VacJ family lipoprotein [Alphaproteobacteria bacterium]